MQASSGLACDLEDSVTVHWPHGTLTADVGELTANDYRLEGAVSMRRDVRAVDHSAGGVRGPSPAGYPNGFSSAARPSPAPSTTRPPSPGTRWRRRRDRRTRA